MNTLRPLLLSLSFCIPAALSAQIKDANLDLFTYRNFSPHRVGSWVSDIAVPETDDPAYDHTYYVAGRHSGVWKTVNKGISYEPVFEQYGNLSIGAIEVARSNPELVWVGTGEASCARSAHAGNGIYRSLDGGMTFRNMGLKDSHHIPRIVTHPTNENIVYVAAMGHLFSPNEERGVFKTKDGGESWEKVLYIDDRIGVIDLVIHPEDPRILYAASYDKARYPWHYEAGGPGSGIYKTTDGGASWVRLSGGLPEGKLGRIGIDIYRSDPDVLYTVIENLNIREDAVVEDQEEYNKLKDTYFDRFVGGEVYRSGNAGSDWVKMNADTVDVSSKAAYSFNQIMIDPNDENNLFINNVYLQSSHDRGRTWFDWEGSPKHLFTNMFGDVRTFWIDPEDSRHMLVGSDGGVYLTYDGGKHMQHHYHLPFGEMYSIETDMETPYNLYVGLQDHEGWKAPSNGAMRRISTEDWRVVGMWDGMYHGVDKVDKRWLYFTTQFGAHHRVNQSEGERINIEPKAAEGRPPYRYTWNTPLVMSPHDNKTIYTGGQMLLRSRDQGDSWEEISPDLSTNDPEKIAGKGHIMYCCISTISESPLVPGVIWVGTDDGRVHMTPDGGESWKEFTRKIEKEGVPDERWVSRVFASHHDPDRAYVCKSGYRNDDVEPYIFVTNNAGRSWEKIASNLPKQPVNAIWEDDINPDLLFLGNDHGVYVSLNRGKNWFNFNQNVPAVPVKDLHVHPRDRDLVMATYGRGAYVTDIYPFRELSPELLEKTVHLFDVEPKPQLNYSQQAYWGNSRLMGDSQLSTPNEANGLTIYFYLREVSDEKVTISIANDAGEQVFEKCEVYKKGFNKITWNTSRTEPGSYKVKLSQGDKILEKNAQVLERWKWSVGNVNAGTSRK